MYPKKGDIMTTIEELKKDRDKARKYIMGNWLTAFIDNDRELHHNINEILRWLIETAEITNIPPDDKDDLGDTFLSLGCYPHGISIVNNEIGYNMEIDKRIVVKE